MTGGFSLDALLRGLAFRVLLFLSMALLPIGLIAVVQTREIAKQSEINAELSLLALTEQATAPQRSVIQTGYGAAQALGSVVQLYEDELSACRAFLREYQQSSGIYSMVGYLQPSGRMTCSSEDRAFDFSQHPDFAGLIENPGRTAGVSAVAPISGQPVIYLSQPFFEGDRLLGFISLSIPTDNIPLEMQDEAGRKPVALVTFNARGQLLMSGPQGLSADAELPTNRNLSLLADAGASVFTDTNQVGQERTYAVVPILPGVIYSMGIWEDATAPSDLVIPRKLSTFLPVTMWLASLVVAFWALNRLAITHIKKLGRQMRFFAFNRTLPRSSMGAGVPKEIIDMEHAFVGMAEAIIRDEASLEDSLREKNILLKEVHHRVKNNLQLISSIMSMQIRQAKSDDARRVLKRLQERILGLATVHKNLYQNNNLARVNAGALVEEIVDQLLVVGLPAGSKVKVEKSFEAISLEPDDAAPLTLMVSEAVTNAMKYIQTPKPGVQPLLEISLRRTGPKEAEFVICNTTGAVEPEHGTGLGSQLIKAFARQLNGQVEVDEQDDRYCLTLQFHVQDESKPICDF